LITLVSKAGHLRIINKKKVLNKLSHEKKHMNEIIISIRRKVKSLYSWVKQHPCSFKIIL
jgi:hypothetical protein